MTDLKDLVKKISENKKLVAIDLEAAPRNTLPSLQAMVFNAREELKTQLLEYAGRIRANGVGILMYGDSARQNEFAALAVAEAPGTVHVRADELYDNLAARVEPTLGASKDFSTTQLQVLHDELRFYRDQLGISGLTMPMMTDIICVPTRKALVNYVRDLVRKVAQDDLMRLYVDKKINDLAVEQHFSSKTLPVVVTGLFDPAEAAAVSDLFSKKSAVDVGTSDDEVNKEFVLNALTNVRKQFVSKSKQ